MRRALFANGKCFLECIAAVDATDRAHEGDLKKGKNLRRRG